MEKFGYNMGNTIIKNLFPHFNYSKFKRSEVVEKSKKTVRFFTK